MPAAASAAPAAFSAPAALTDARVWRAAERGAPEATLPSGHPALDAELPGGGWPSQGLIEIELPPGLHPEWRLLLPALARLQANSPGICVLVGPPHAPFAPALQAQGLRPDRLLWIDVDEAPARLWATEQALRSAGVLAVLAWLPQAGSAALRRLHLGAQSGGKPLFALRPPSRHPEASPALLRLVVDPPGATAPTRPGVTAPTRPVGVSGGRSGVLQLRLLKRRGPPLPRPLCLPPREGRLSALLEAAGRAGHPDGQPGLPDGTQRVAEAWIGAPVDAPSGAPTAAPSVAPSGWLRHPQAHGLDRAAAPV